MIDVVTAQAAPGAMDYLNSLLVPTILIIGIMYFLMIRPQQKRMKEHQAMLGALRRGDNVVTSGGILGKIVKADETELQIEVADGVRLRVLRSSIAEVRGKPEPGKSESGKSEPGKPAGRSAKASKSADSETEES